MSEPSWVVFGLKRLVRSLSFSDFSDVNFVNLPQLSIVYWCFVKCKSVLCEKALGITDFHRFDSLELLSLLFSDQLIHPLDVGFPLNRESHFRRGRGPRVWHSVVSVLSLSSLSAFLKDWVWGGRGLIHKLRLLPFKSDEMVQVGASTLHPSKLIPDFEEASSNELAVGATSYHFNDVVICQQCKLSFQLNWNTPITSGLFAFFLLVWPVLLSAVSLLKSFVNA